MSKKVLALIFVIISLFVFAVPAFADYGQTIPVSAVGTNNDLIYVKRPESCYASTSDKTYTISAVGSVGTKIKIYKYNPSNGEYVLVKGETQIGASGLYSTVVDLDSNTNSFKVYANNAYGDQIVDISINKIKQSTVDKLKGITVTIRNFFN